MECPKCAQQSVLKDEDFVQLVDGALVVKQSFECTQCGFMFSRIGTKPVDGVHVKRAEQAESDDAIEFTNRV